MWKSFFKSRKAVALLLLAAGFVLVFLLAASIGSIQLSPGQAFRLPRSPTPTLQNVPTGELIDKDFIMTGIRILLAVALLLLPISLIYALSTKQGRRRLIMNLITVGLLLLLLNRLRENAKERAGQEINPLGAAGNLPELQTLVPEVTFNTQPDEWLVWVSTFLLILIIVLLGYLFIRALWARSSRMTPMQRLAKQAQEAIDSLEDGMNFRDAVLRCYQQMIRVVQEEWGIARDRTMTPREFEDVLTERGLPVESVRRLTRLFEAVRYGSQEAGANEERQAVVCLADIVEACKQARTAA